MRLYIYIRNNNNKKTFSYFITPPPSQTHQTQNQLSELGLSNFPMLEIMCVCVCVF